MTCYKEQKTYIDNKLCRFCGQKFKIDPDIYFSSKFKEPMLYKNRFIKYRYQDSFKETSDMLALRDAQATVKAFSSQSVKDMTSSMDERARNRIYANTYKVAYCSCGKSEKIIPIYTTSKSHIKEKILRKLLDKRPILTKRTKSILDLL